MLKISIVESPARVRLVLEGKLTAPWVGELRRTWDAVQTELRGRKPLIELRNVTHISQEGEHALLELMTAGARFTCHGVFTKRVMEQLALELRPRSGGLRLPHCTDKDDLKNEGM